MAATLPLCWRNSITLIRANMWVNLGCAGHHLHAQTSCFCIGLCRRGVAKGFCSLVWQFSYVHGLFGAPFGPNSLVSLTETDEQGVGWGKTSVLIDLAIFWFLTSPSTSTPAPPPRASWTFDMHQTDSKAVTRLEIKTISLSLMSQNMIFGCLSICWWRFERTNPRTTARYSSYQARGGCWWSERAYKPSNIHHGDICWPT